MLGGAFPLQPVVHGRGEGGLLLPVVVAHRPADASSKHTLTAWARCRLARRLHHLGLACAGCLIGAEGFRRSAGEVGGWGRRGAGRRRGYRTKASGRSSSTTWSSRWRADQAGPDPGRFGPPLPTPPRRP